jgi:signal transduction histidine kinase
VLLPRRSQGGQGTGQQVWPVLLLLLAAVVVPTVCVLWFMSQAIRNERLAVRHELSQVYRGHLGGVRDQILAEWGRRIGEMGKVGSNTPAPEVFETLVSRGLCDSVILRDRTGNIRYPSADSTLAPAPEPSSDDWERARQLEYQERNPTAAAEAYAEIAKQADDTNIAAMALQAQARCLASTGQIDTALDILTSTLADPKYLQATDAHGRLVVPAARLQALQLMKDRGPRFKETLEALLREVKSYRQTAMPRSQRLFIMHELRALAPDRPLPTLAAEDLADSYTAAMPTAQAAPTMFPLLLRNAWSATPAEAAAPYLRPSPVKGLWQIELSEGTIVALYRQTSIIDAARSIISSRPLSEAMVELVPPTEQEAAREPLQTLAVGDLMPEWRLNAYLADTGAVARTAGRQETLYLWTAILGIVVIALLALLVAGYVTRQMKLTRLKNDLIATVSHELRTPLASTRALVETLLEGRYRDERQAREYLELVSKENARLSRLIDNFLTFSRMERNKRAFEQVPVRVNDVVKAATEVVSDRFAAPGCRLELQVEPDLPAVIGDRDALTTAVLNLLDNAYKYTGDEKHVVLRAKTEDRHVRVEVEDNGIGISRRSMRRIFDRFYQVDQSLSRKAGGCGLGLSIVKFIVDAHGGQIDVQSRVGAGSTFVVRIPFAVGNDE